MSGWRHLYDVYAHEDHIEGSVRLFSRFRHPRSAKSLIDRGARRRGIRARGAAPAA